MRAGIEDARWDQVQAECTEIVDDRVAGVIATLETHHDIGLPCQVVYHPTLALVAPLGADNCRDRHANSPYVYVCEIYDPNRKAEYI